MSGKVEESCFSLLSEFSSDFTIFRVFLDFSEKFSCIDVIREMPYISFCKKYLIGNKPCLLRPSSVVTTSWKSRKKWTLDDGTPNFMYLNMKFGDCIVPVADCNVKEYNSQLKHEMPLKQYLSYWQELISSNHNFSTFPCLYMKDWHFCKDFPEYKAYTTPLFFASDWLNEFSKQQTSDDYRFVYMGPKGSWTPFHADVFGSFSWSVNVSGRKRWLLFPPGAEQFLRDEHNQLIYDVTDSELLASGKYPKATNLFNEWGSGIEVIQEPGDAIFVPSGWHHQVWNLEDTISINHNWFNGCNVDLIWKNILEALRDVEKELDDCKDSADWPETCQVVLKTHHGMNVNDFYKMLVCIADKAEVQLLSQFQSEKCLAMFDLVRISYVLKLMCQENVIKLINLEDTLLSFSSRIDNMRKVDILECFH